MPINYQDILGSIAEIAEKAPKFQQDLNQRREDARNLFSEQIDRQELRDKISQAVNLSRNLRCAVPTDEAVNRAFPLPEETVECDLIAVDGSQINPSRHLAVRYYLLNLGIICYPADPDGIPEASRRSKLVSEIDLPWKGINEDRVAYLRDVEERRVISELVKERGNGARVITLTDGPLELWLRSGDGPQTADDKQKMLEKYLDALLELNDMGAVTAGYVDKPRASLVIEALELYKLKPGEFNQRHTEKIDYHQFDGVTDGDLFSNLLTAPGARSAVFELQFSEAHFYTEKSPELGLHFFYLNVSREEGDPVLARVEIPAWVAADGGKLAALQAALFRQCGIMGTVRYPYVLHRSHEEAVVTFEEKEELDRLIIEEFAKKGVPVGALSQKQTAKNLSTGRRRYSVGKRKF